MSTGSPRPPDHPRWRASTGGLQGVWRQARWRLATVAMLVGLVVAVGHAVLGGTAENGPLGVSRAVDGTECIPRDFGPRVILAGDPLDNTSTAPVVVDSVRLSGASEVTLDASLLAPIKDNTLLGYQSYPPRIGGEVLTPRRPAVGATVAAGQQLNLVVVVSVSRIPAHVGWIEVSYHQGGDRFVRRFSTTVDFKQRC